MSYPQLNWNRIDDIIDNALSEDIGSGDVTADTLFAPAEKARAFILGKGDGIVAGLPVAQRVFQKLDQQVTWQARVEDGQRVEAGMLLAEVNGSRRAILSGERLALNFLQRLSGIASLTARFVNAIKDTPAKLLDTRKTTPGLRHLEKYAVRMGGGHNHRFGLFDGIMIKDNHIKLAGGITAAVQKIRRKNIGMPIEVETRNIEEVREALAAGVDIIMLDNFSLPTLQQAVKLIDGQTRVEASGGITLEKIGAVAASGVDYISVGALTHSPRALDIGLYFY